MIEASVSSLGLRLSPWAPVSTSASPLPVYIGTDVCVIYIMLFVRALTSFIARVGRDLGSNLWLAAGCHRRERSNSASAIDFAWICPAVAFCFLYLALTLVDRLFYALG
jgi:hypothetical protein